MTFSESYLSEATIVMAGIDCAQVDALVHALRPHRDDRIFVIGLGGSAAHASHAAHDLRTLCGFDAICLADSVTTLTAHANDHGWPYAFGRSLREAGVGLNDALLVLSVGGGSEEVSVPLVRAMEYAKRHGVKVYAIVGRDGGRARELADVCILIPPTYPDHVTPHTEGLMSVVLHCLVSHPALQVQQPKWESLG